MSLDVSAIVRAVLRVTRGPVGHHTPVVTDEDRLAVLAQIDDLGSYSVINDFEQTLAARCSRRHCIATASGTAALEVALASVGVKPRTTVAVPALAFVAVANAVRHLGATPLLIDIESNTGGMNPTALARELRSADFSAVIAVHNLGHPCDIRGICEVANLYGVPVVEDACEALGSVVYGDPVRSVRPCGSWGQVSVMSFNLNKIVTTAGGGAIMCDDEKIANLARRLATTARVPHPWLVEHDAVAWNARMPMLCAALGSSQIKRLERLVIAKRFIADAYKELLEDIEGVTFWDEPESTHSNFWLPTVMVASKDRDAVLTGLHDVGVMARAMFTPINQLPPYRQDGYWAADKMFKQAVCLPGGLGLAGRCL